MMTFSIPGGNNSVGYTRKSLNSPFNPLRTGWGRGGGLNPPLSKIQKFCLHPLTALIINENIFEKVIFRGVFQVSTLKTEKNFQQNVLVAFCI